MVWGIISWNGVGKLVKVSGNINSVDYCKLLEENLEQSINMMGLGDRWIFQQDNAAIHVSRYSKAWFEDNQVMVMKWPSQSPDLNPIGTKVTLF